MSKVTIYPQFPAESVASGMSINSSPRSGRFAVVRYFRVGLIVSGTHSLIAMVFYQSRSFGVLSRSIKAIQVSHSLVILLVS
jgi:hypothetical protein